MQKFFSNRKLVIAVICVIIAVGLVTLSVTTRKSLRHQLSKKWVMMQLQWLIE